MGHWFMVGLSVRPRVSIMANMGRERFEIVDFMIGCPSSFSFEFLFYKWFIYCEIFKGGKIQNITKNRAVFFFCLRVD